MRSTRQRAMFYGLALGLGLWLAACETTAPSRAPAPPAPPTAPSTAPATPPPAPTPPATPAPIPDLFLPIKAGLILPMEGPDAALGLAMWQAARMALMDAKLGDDLTLLPRAVNGDPAQTLAAAQELAQEGVQVIIGPLYGADLARAAQALPGQTWIGFSNDAQLRGAGIFLMGHDGAAQAYRVARLAADRGLQRIVALLPRSPYGDRALAGVQAALRDALPARLVAVERYSGTNTALGVAALAPRLAEADAVFIADGPGGLRAAVAALLAQGFDPNRQRLLTTAMIETGELVEDPMFAGAWYAAPERAAFDRFASRMAQDTGQAPPRLAALGYDAVAFLAKRVERAKRDHAAFTARSLEGYDGLDGAEGFLRLIPSGLAERAIAVYQAGPQGPEPRDPPRVIAPAPQY